MHPKIIAIQKCIEPLRQDIMNHKVYPFITNLDELRIFMQHHVYAVWDFMSLLKSLQNNLTCTAVPWFPRGNADTRFLINEIVVGEEADIDQNGIRKSHFELYLDAMEQIGASTNGIKTFINAIQTGSNFKEAFELAQTPERVQSFVQFTFNIIQNQVSAVQSAVFTFGREDLIPGMFINLVEDINQTFPENVSVFKYYLERHIEVDGDHHSHLALQMTEQLCGENEQLWESSLKASIESLEKRKALWDGVYDAITKQRVLVSD